MSKINYRVCDICGKTLKTDIRLSGYLNGCRIWNKLFNSLDMCDDCISKIKRLSIDKKEEEKYLKEVFDNAMDYPDQDMKSAYYKGLEDALSVLSHKRLAKIKMQNESN